MADTWDPPEEPSASNGVKIGWGKKVRNCLLWLYSQIGSSSPGGIPNGSAEIDSDEDGTPDTWTYDDYPGGTGGIETTSPAQGAKAFYCTHPGGSGNGGRAWESDYMEISEDISPILLFFHWATAAGMKNIVRFKYYDKDKNHLTGSDEDIYSSTSNPTTRTAFVRFGIPPATARFLKVVLIGGYTDTDVAGTCYFDGLQFDPSPRVIFDNFTVASGSYSGGSTSYEDLNSASVRLPKGFSLMLLPITLITAPSTENGARYRISSTYSTGYINLSPLSTGQVELNISALSGSQTLYTQGYRSPAAAAITVQKIDTNAIYIRR